MYKKNELRYMPWQCSRNHSSLDPGETSINSEVSRGSKLFDT